MTILNFRRGEASAFRKLFEVGQVFNSDHPASPEGQDPLHE